jgi:hypothetical protein
VYGVTMQEPGVSSLVSVRMRAASTEASVPATSTETSVPIESVIESAAATS